MDSNKKAERFRGKAQLKDLAVQAEGVEQRLERLQNGLIAVFQKMFTLEQKVDSTYSMAKVADWRSLAIQKLLSSAGITEDQIVAKVMELQAQSFDEQSARDDQDRGLTDANGEEAATGMSAITTIKLFKDGKEMEDRMIQRSKVELGKGELFPEMDTALLGAKVGETRRFNVQVNNETVEAEVTLLGLRKAATSATENQSNG